MAKGYRVKRRKKKRIILFAFLLLCVGIYLFFSFSIQPVIRTISQESIRSLTVETVNESVHAVMENNPAYVDLTRIVKDNDGNITMIYADSVTVNALARNVTVTAQKSLDKLAERGIGIPIGSLSGISFLSGRGPSVNIKAIPVGNIETAFSSRFIPAGINQTLHKMFINVTACVSIIIPGSEHKITTTTQVLVSECIIIGKVPSIYLQTQSDGKDYNFIP